MSKAPPRVQDLEGALEICHRPEPASVQAPANIRHCSLSPGLHPYQCIDSSGSCLSISVCLCFPICAMGPGACTLACLWDEMAAWAQPRGTGVSDWLFNPTSSGLPGFARDILVLTPAKPVALGKRGWWFPH